MSPLRAASVSLSLSGAAGGAFVAYLAASGEAQGPISSGWMLLLLVVAVLRLAAAGYGVVLFLMQRRSAPQPLGVAAVSAGPVAGLFLAGALLGGLAHLRRDSEPQATISRPIPIVIDEAQNLGATPEARAHRTAAAARWAGQAGRTRANRQ